MKIQNLLSWSVLKFSFYTCSVILLMMLQFNSCKNKEQGNADNLPVSSESFSADTSLPQDFFEFYKLFHEDSLFQILHIDFPLKGLPQNADPEDPNYDDFYYTKDQWEIHKAFDLNQFNREFVNMADIVIEERITEKKYGLMIIRRFSKGSDGWRLIYYAALNKYKVPE